MNITGLGSLGGPRHWDGSNLVLADCKNFKVFYVNSYKYIIFDNITDSPVCNCS